MSTDKANERDSRSFTGAPTSGAFETTFTVTDTAFPVAATVVSDPLVLAVEVVDAAGDRMAHPLASVSTATRRRQHHYTFDPPEPGDYTLRVLVPPGQPLIADLSHSTAPAEDG